MAKTYDTYKDSGIAWIGGIPGEWEVLKNKYTYSFIYSGGTPTASEEKYYYDEGFAFVSISDMSTTEYVKETKKHLTNEGIANKNLKVLPKGTVLFSIYATVGAVSELLIEATISQAILAIGLKKEIDKSYYKYNLKSMKDYIFSQANGNTQFNLNAEKVANFTICFPPLSVQQSISSFLDTKCGEIDSLISIQEEMISELLAYKQSVITEAVTKGLDKKAKMKNSGVEWIGDIPEEWEVIKIQYLNQGLTDGTHGTYNRVDKGRLLLSSKNVREKDLLITDSESQISEEDYQSIISNGFPKKGDLLMCCIGASIGRCIIYKYDETYAFQRSVIFIRCNKLIKPELLRYNLLSNNSLLQELFLINQSAQAGLYQGQVKEIKVIVPPISKQKQIIDYLDEKTSQIDSLIALKQSKIESLKEYKKSIIYEYVTGKKRV